MELNDYRESVDFDFFDDGNGDGDKQKSQPVYSNVTGKVPDTETVKQPSVILDDKGISGNDVKTTKVYNGSESSGSYSSSSEADSDGEFNNKKNERCTGSAHSASSRTSSISQLSVKIPSAQNGTEAHNSENEVYERYRENISDDGEKRSKGYNLVEKEKRDESNQVSSRRVRLKSAKVRRRVENNNLSSSEEELSGKSSASSHRSYSNSSCSSSTTYSDSDSDVTDVSPLHSPQVCRSPENTNDIQNLRLKSKLKQNSKARKKEGVRFEEISTPGESIHGKRLQDRDSDSNELSMLLRAVLELDETPSKYELNSLQRKLRPSSGRSASSSQSSQSRRSSKGKQMPHHRMNLSFSNDEVRRIDRENQRLLQNIISSKPSMPASQPRGARRSMKQAPSSHSAVRRQRDQRRIEIENLKILERIQAAKASPTVQKDRLIKEHHKQMQYGNQVGKSPMRPDSARKTGKAYAAKMAKASSMSSLGSDWSRATSATSSTRSRPSSGKVSFMEEPISGQSRPAWDDHWQSNF